MEYRYSAFKHYGIKATYMYANVASQMLYILKEKIAYYFAQNTSVLVFNIGQWNLQYLDYATYVSDMMEVFSTIQSLQRAYPQVQFVWVETEAVNFNKERLRFKTNFAMSAMNDWVNYNMRKLELKVIPAFDITILMQTYTTDGCHYLDLLQQDVNKNRVSVGGAIDSVLFHKICP